MGSFLSQGLSLGAGILGNALGLNREQRSGGYESPYAGQVNEYLGALSPMAAREFDFYGQNLGRRFSALDGAYNALSPTNNVHLAQAIARRVRASSVGQGEANARRLGKAGYGTSVQQGARLGAMNQANDTAGQIQLELLNPSRIASQYQQQAGVYDFGNIGQSLGAVQGLIGTGNNMALQRFGTQQVQPSIAQSLFSAGMQVIPDIVNQRRRASIPSDSIFRTFGTGF